MTSPDPASTPGSFSTAGRRDVLGQLAYLAEASVVSATAEDPDAAKCDIAEVVIIGGGPAGLSAAMVLARARREVILIDGGIPRNAAAPAVHTFVTRDGILPSDFRKIARGQLARYPSVIFRDGLVRSIRGEAGAFEVVLAEGGPIRCRYVLLALGLVDELPGIPGLRENWGRGVHHCSFCDGYEHRDGKWGVLVEDPAALEHAPFFLGWTRDLTFFTQGMAIPDEVRSGLVEKGIVIEERKLREVRPGPNEHSLESVVLENGSVILLSSLWIQPKQSQTRLVQSLDLTLREDGAVERSESGESSIPGIFAAGDLSAGRMQQALLAAADGAKIAYLLTRQLVLPH